MKTIVTCLLICLYLQPTSGQSIYFEKTLDYNGFTDHSNGVLIDNDEYVFIYSGIKYINPRISSICFSKLTFDGTETLVDTCYQLDSIEFYHTWVSKYKNTISAVGYRWEIGTQNQSRGLSLINMDLNGKLKSINTIFNDSINFYPTTFISDSSGYIVTGQTTRTDGSDADMFLMKVDTSQNIVFNKTYGGPNFEGAYSAAPTPDGGFLLLGWTRSFGAVGIKQWYLVKTDSIGNQEWQKTFNSNNDASGWGITLSIDGNYILTGGGGGGRARIIKVTSLGDVIWSKFYTYPGSSNGSNYLFWSKELPDASIVSVGLTNNSIEGDAGYLQKTDANGNLLWQHKYNYNEYTDLFYNVLPTTDGGFLLSGQCRHITDSTSSQDAWLLKVDSLGCPYPNCTVGIAEESKVVAFNLWPNPASNVLNIEIFNHKTSIIKLIDVTGRVVLTLPIPSEGGVGGGRLDLASFARGLYTVQVQGKNGVITKKLVVE